MDTSYYAENESYAEYLDGLRLGCYRRYADALRPDRPGARALDVGCGVGRVVGDLAARGVEAHGVDVSQANLRRAMERSPHCRLYDGRHLPYPDGHFASAGALNVLEHVEEPERFLAELVRVVEPGGRIVVSSPNFLRVLGFRDYHPAMRGLRNKLANLRRLLRKRRQMAREPAAVRFDRMVPIVREPFVADDDATVATNALEIAFFLRGLGAEVRQVSCIDRPVPRWLEFLVDATPLRYGLLNAFVVAAKASSGPRAADAGVTP
jgi:SAM-dependent methyltransferase